MSCRPAAGLPHLRCGCANGPSGIEHRDIPPGVERPDRVGHRCADHREQPRRRVGRAAVSVKHSDRGRSREPDRPAHLRQTVMVDVGQLLTIRLGQPCIDQRRESFPVVRATVGELRHGSIELRWARRRRIEHCELGVRVGGGGERGHGRVPSFESGGDVAAHGVETR